MQAITKMWYDYLEEGKLMGLKCEKCGTVHFPPFPVCRECSGTDMKWVPVSGEGMVREVALVTVPDAWFAEYAPYYYAYANTDEGSSFDSMLLGLDGTPDEIFNKIVPRLPFKAKLEIQKREGYSYPAYRFEAD